MDELAAEKLEAEAMRKIQYGDKEWQANALRGGMPWWKYISNRFLTFVENVRSLNEPNDRCNSNLWRP